MMNIYSSIQASLELIDAAHVKQYSDFGIILDNVAYFFEPFQICPQRVLIQRPLPRTLTEKELTLIHAYATKALIRSSHTLFRFEVAWLYEPNSVDVRLDGIIDYTSDPTHASYRLYTEEEILGIDL